MKKLVLLMCLVASVAVVAQQPRRGGGARGARRGTAASIGLAVESARPGMGRRSLEPARRRVAAREGASAIRRRGAGRGARQGGRVEADARRAGTSAACRWWPTIFRATSTSCIATATSIRSWCSTPRATTCARGARASSTIRTASASIAKTMSGSSIAPARS